MSKVFPSAKVKKIIDFSGFIFKTDTYYRFETLDYEQLKELIAIGAASLKDAQNSGPTIHKLINWIEENGYQKAVTLFGYVIFPPRVDARVTIDGLYLTVPGLEAVPECYNLALSAQPDDGEWTMVDVLPVVEGIMAAQSLNPTPLRVLREVLTALPNASEEDFQIFGGATVLRLWWD